MPPQRMTYPSSRRILPRDLFRVARASLDYRDQALSNLISLDPDPVARVTFYRNNFIVDKN